MTTPTDRLTEIKARVARYKEELSGMRRSNDSFWVSDLEYALAEIERLTGERQDTNMAIDIVCAERDRLRAEVGRLRAALTEVLEDNDKEVDCAHGISWEVEARARAALEGSK